MEQPRPGGKVPGRGSPTYTEDDALQCVLRLTEEPPADLRGAGVSGSRAAPTVQPPQNTRYQLSWRRPAGETVGDADL